MKIIQLGQQSGKTTKLVVWVKQGKRTDSYPGWSRVIVTPNFQQAEFLRTTREFNLDYRQVFSISEWRNARLGRESVEVAIDNADHILEELIGPSQLSIATFNME